MEDSAKTDSGKIEKDRVHSSVKIEKCIELNKDRKDKVNHIGLGSEHNRETIEKNIMIYSRKLKEIEKMCSREDIQDALRRRLEVSRRGKKLREELKKRVRNLAIIKDKIARGELINKTLEEALQEAEDIQGNIVGDDEDYDKCIESLDDTIELGRPVVSMKDEFQLKSPNEEFSMKVHMNLAVQNMIKKTENPTKNFSVTYYFKRWN